MDINIYLNYIRSNFPDLDTLSPHYITFHTRVRVRLNYCSQFC